MIIPIHIILGIVAIIMILIYKAKGSHAKKSPLRVSILTGVIFLLLYIIFFWGGIYLAWYNLLSARWIYYTYIPFYPILKWIDDIPNKETENILWGISLPLLWGGLGFILAEVIEGIRIILKRLKGAV